MNEQSQKKARFTQKEENETDNMEIDAEAVVPPEWASFVKDNDFSETIVADLQEASHNPVFSESTDKVGILVFALTKEHPTFTKKLAAEALQILEPESAESSHSSHRGPSITDGLETRLVHTLDLKAFEARVNGLFEWHERAAVRNKILAPYFAIVQSSGMGKTKLFFEFRKEYNLGEPKCVCKTILCLDAKLDKKNQDKYFDHRLHVDTNDVRRIVEEVWESMNLIVSNTTSGTRPEKLVLLFDEAQGLMRGTDESGKKSLVFRAIRWWLRQERREQPFEIVAVFAGTTAALTNFFPPDPPEPGVSRHKTVHYKNYTEGDQDMKKLNPPFYQLHTVACLRREKPSLKTQAAADPGFPQAAIYGRPLFAYYYLKGTLDKKKMNEFENRLVLSVPKYEENLSSCYSVLGSRVQMGVVNSFHTLSALISSGYACLADFRQQDDSKSTPVAGVTFMPDPLCATMAMRFMDEDWQDGALKGKGKKFWAEQAEKAFTTKLCLPDKGDAGEVFAALYMLFCGDVLRKKADATLSSFAVSLDKWFGLVKNCGRAPISDTGQKEEDGTSTLVSSTESSLGRTRSQSALKGQIKTMGEVESTVSFVQVCRNDFRSNSFCETERLEYMYRSGLGSFAYKNCKAFDIDASIKVVKGTHTSYQPLLVSVKNWAKVTKGDVVGWLSSMKSFLIELRGEDKKPSAVCLIILLGCSKPPEITEDDLSSPSLAPFPATDVYRLVCVEDDEFGVSQAIQNLGTSSELSEVYSSHAFMACEKSPNDLLRKSSSVNQGAVNEIFSALKLPTNDNDAGGGKPKHTQG